MLSIKLSKIKFTMLNYLSDTNKIYPFINERVTTLREN